ncbi:hypothetical protein [Umezawaea tangerina]|uniref:Uncharacterized protein n=1 Tax=Umezawaea tangerina TaxID=84725 RepID=A0A2T0T4H0_9PSEU|nr:hypothetical protein [Umezawaea tangerina]PRY40524.1 hypothetical protein CLV43_106261 [Umezawaea tangerina]
MKSRKKPDLEVKAYGQQLDSFDLDLVVQLVIMLGRELVKEDVDAEDE